MKARERLNKDKKTNRKINRYIITLFLCYILFGQISKAIKS